MAPLLHLYPSHGPQSCMAGCNLEILQGVPEKLPKMSIISRACANWVKALACP
jgi:hypothetical protein